MRFHDLAEILVNIVPTFHVHNAPLDVKQGLDDLLRGRGGGLKNLLRARFGGYWRGHGEEDQAAMRL